MTRVEREEIGFPSGGLRCAATLFRPQGAARPPVVVMAHGFGGTRDLQLPRYAERFAARGVAALVFDYRHFGGSEGEPRQLLRIGMQHEDWRAALAHVRARGDLDAGRVGLWGTSLSGGHVLVTAAEDGEVACVVAQVPFVDARARPPGDPGPRWRLRALGAALRDRLRALLRRPPHTVPIVAEPGAFAMLATPSSREGYLALVPPGGSSPWRNRIGARVLFDMASYRPGLRAADVRCPLLLVAARDDDLIPLSAVEAVAARAPRAALRVVDAGHFDVYVDPRFDEVAEEEAAFLAAHLGAGARPG
ncbi:MAG: alpha/beta fold hydrolase [Myxococcota bacterium]|nr:alpha/beta fold hydrolase [Myxococcota bacterium]